MSFTVADFNKVLDDVGAEPDDHLVIVNQRVEMFGLSNELFALRQQIANHPVHTVVYLPIEP